MLQIQLNPFPQISTERLHLRLAELSDGPEIFYLRSNENLMRYLDRAPLKDLLEAEQLISRIREDAKNNQGLNWVINLKPETQVIGTIGFWKFDFPNFRAEIGYMLHPEHQGKGLMSEAMKSVLEYGFHTIGLHSVEANVNPENEASIRLLERHGFRQEAYFRENYFYDGRFLDSAIYCLLTPAQKSFH